MTPLCLRRLPAPRRDHAHRRPIAKAGTPPCTRKLLRRPPLTYRHLRMRCRISSRGGKRGNDAGAYKEMRTLAEWTAEPSSPIRAISRNKTGLRLAPWTVRASGRAHEHHCYPSMVRRPSSIVCPPTAIPLRRRQVCAKIAQSRHPKFEIGRVSRRRREGRNCTRLEGAKDAQDADSRVGVGVFSL